MYFDLFLPFPLPEVTEQPKKKKSKTGQGGQSANSTSNEAGPSRTSCWDGLSSSERDRYAKSTGLSGHLGYSVIGCTVPQAASPHVYPSPFSKSLPFPNLDPREQSSAGPSSNATASSSRNNVMGLKMVQVSRYHVRLDDTKTHPFTGANAATLKDYDLLSVQPMTDKAFQLAATDLCLPGPNQISIITLPLHEKPYHFRLNRKQVRQAQRNGVMFELIYSPALFPSSSTPKDIARRYRQNFLSNAREVVRLTGGKNIIFSSGPGGSEEGMRGPLDIINLGTMIGLPSNLAKDAVSANPKRALLNAQSRRTFKGVMSMPRLVPPPNSMEKADGIKKRPLEAEAAESGDVAKKARSGGDAVR